MPTSGSALQSFVNRLISRSILTAEEVSAILSLRGHLQKIPAHIDFVRLGEHVDHACLIVEGLVGRFGQNNEGGRQITCLHIAGDLADLPSVVSPKAGWGLMALAPTTILRVPHTDLRRVAAKHSGVSEAFWRDCLADGSIFSEWIVNVGRRSALSRLAHLFCEMAVRSERAALGGRNSYSLPLTQSDLADATGLTPVHVNRILKQLKAQGIVAFSKGAVTVHDWNHLVVVGDFHDAFMLLDGPAPRISEMGRSAAMPAAA